MNKQTKLSFVSQKSQRNFNINYCFFFLCMISCSCLLEAQVLFFGVTRKGAVNSGGNIFRTDGNGENYEVMHDFDNLDFFKTVGKSIMQASNGMIYGICQSAGISGEGSLFQYNLLNHAYESIASFGDSNGSNSSRSLPKENDGMFYDVTTGRSKNALSIKHHFNMGDGNGAIQLTVGSNGILYGYGSDGGANFYE